MADFVKDISSAAKQRTRIEAQIEIVGGKYLFNGGEGDAANWVDGGGAALVLITNDATVRQEGEASLRFVNTDADSLKGVARRNFTRDDWKKYRFLQFWWRRISAAGTQTVRITDGAGAFIDFNIPALAINTWKVVEIDMQGTPDASSGTLDLDNITRLEFRSLASGQTYYVDALIVSPEFGLGRALAAIGFNNADNGYSTDQVVANRDGSLFERAEALQSAVDSAAAAGVTDHSRIESSLESGSYGLSVLDSEVDSAAQQGSVAASRVQSSLENGGFGLSALESELQSTIDDSRAYSQLLSAVDQNEAYISRVASTVEASGFGNSVVESELESAAQNLSTIRSTIESSSFGQSVVESELESAVKVLDEGRTTKFISEVNATPVATPSNVWTAVKTGGFSDPYDIRRIRMDIQSFVGSEPATVQYRIKIGTTIVYPYTGAETFTDQVEATLEDHGVHAESGKSYIIEVRPTDAAGISIVLDWVKIQQKVAGIA